MAEGRWVEATTNSEGQSFPWPVFVGDYDHFIDPEEKHRKLSKVVLDCAGDNFSPGTVGRSLWCGFSGSMTLFRASHPDHLRQTHAVTTEEFRSEGVPNPLSYAFQRGIINLPTVAMYSPDYLVPSELGQDLFDIKPETGSLDEITQALFVFYSRELEASLNTG